MPPDKKRKKFSKEGSVVRITMKNFMIYTHETIWPGERHNSSYRRMLLFMRILLFKVSGAEPARF